MPGDDDRGAGATPQTGGRRRSLTRRQKRLAIAAAVFIIATFFALWGAQPQEFVTPSQLAANPSGYSGALIQLRGVVSGLDTSARTFLVGDAFTNVTVSYATLPEGFQIGKEVIVKGRVVSLAPVLFTAQDIVVGHPR